MGKKGKGVPVRYIGAKIPYGLYIKLVNYSYEHKKSMSSIITAALSMYLQKEAGIEEENIAKEEEDMLISVIPPPTGEEELLEKESETEPVPEHGTGQYLNKFKASITSWSSEVLKDFLKMPLSEEEKQAIVEELRRRGEQV